MPQGIGISLTERIAVGLVVDDSVSGPLIVNPEDSDDTDSLQGVPGDVIVARIAEQVSRLDLTVAPSHVGLAMPGIIRGGVVEDSPNLAQLKGLQMQTLITDILAPQIGKVPVSIINDADAMAAGMAAARGHLDRLIRLWFLGTGVGYGRYPVQDGIWEAGHSVVSLDPKERFCGCGGSGHLEGIMGLRAMRLRFLDLEPDEVFEQAAAGEARCVEFLKLWHRALAAATASSLHVSGPGKFFVTGPAAKYVNPALVMEYLQEMVKLSPLQSYAIEIVPGGEHIATIGAAVNAAQSAGLA